MSLFTKAAELERQNRSFALITIIAAEGSSPREKGRMILLPDGRSFGTVGGGPAEKLVCEQGLICLEKGQSRSITYKLDSGDSPNSISMVCGGSMDFFIEVFHPRPSLFLAGGGHVNQALAKLADYLEYPYVCGDIRQDMVSTDRYPGALDRITAPDIASCFRLAAERGWISRETALVIATHNHDDLALEAALNTNCLYIGMLGSKKKTALFLEKMKERGFSKKDLERVHSPVGLDLSAETPAEIAVSIISEIMMLRNGSSGQSLCLPLRHTNKSKKKNAPLLVVRGAGDLATGVICRLWLSGFRVVALEAEHPTVIRRTVSFAQALKEGKTVVEGLEARLCQSKQELESALSGGIIPVVPDPKGLWIGKLKPLAVVDAIMAKKNLGTFKDMARVVIGLGPGFTAGKDVHAVVETMRGHSLGQVILDGSALPDTGIPGTVAGYGRERVVHAPAPGTVEVLKDIGSLVKQGELLACIGSKEVLSPLDGVVRGMISPGSIVSEGLKIADVDPRGDRAYCRLVSDKARAVAGGVLEALLRLVPELVEKQP